MRLLAQCHPRAAPQVPPRAALRGRVTLPPHQKPQARPREYQLDDQYEGPLRQPVEDPLPDVRAEDHDRAEREPDRHGAQRERSEEHTSELQSPCNLVCRLLLEKKNDLLADAAQAAALLVDER